MNWGQAARAGKDDAHWGAIMGFAGYNVGLGFRALRARYHSGKAAASARSASRMDYLRAKYGHLSRAERRILLNTKKIENAYRNFYREAHQYYSGRSIRVRPGQRYRTVLGQRVDARTRMHMREWAEVQGLGEKEGLFINRRLYDYAGSGLYRIPDIRYDPGMMIWDGTIGNKSYLDSQILDFSRFSRGFVTGRVKVYHCGAG